MSLARTDNITVNITGLGTVPVSSIDCDSLSQDQVAELSRQSMNDPRVARSLFNHSGRGDPASLLSAMEVGRQLAPSVSMRSGTKKRERAGQMPSRKEKINQGVEAKREAKLVTSTKAIITCLFFTNAGKVKTIKMDSTDKSFFESKLCNGNIKFDMITPSLSIAYVGGKGKNRLARQHLQKYNLSYIDDIGVKCIIYSMTRSVTLDTLIH